MTSFIRFKSEQEDRVEREMRAPLNITGIRILLWE